MGGPQMSAYGSCPTSCRLSPRGLLRLCTASCSKESSHLHVRCSSWKGAPMGKFAGEDTHDFTAMGSSHAPGTDCTRILPSLTPLASRAFLVPCTSGSMMVWFQRAWTMPMRRELPSWCCGVGPLTEECAMLKLFKVVCRCSNRNTVVC